MARMERGKNGEITCFGGKRKAKYIPTCLTILYYYKKGRKFDFESFEFENS